MKLLRFVMASTLLLCSSAYGADKPIPVGIRVIDSEAARQCRFIDTVFGNGREMVAKDAAFEARKDAMLIAQAAGANAVILKSVALTVGMNVIVVADAYQC